jgi:uncharacterized 2Fe-2S/4Fe-4S cluster protein (DUF4445 family)
MTAKDPLVVFMPSGKRGRFPAGTPLLSAARSLGVDVDSVCGGRGICGRCQVLIAEGEFAKHGVRSGADSVSSVSETELRYAKRRGLPDGHRLSCSTQVQRDVVVDVPPGSQVHRQVVRKDADAREIKLNPVVRLHYVEVSEPDMHDPSGDLRRLLEALAREWGLKDLGCDFTVLGHLQSTLRKGQWKATAAVHDASQVIALWPGFHDKAFGMAVDVGSTTVAAHLCNLETGELAAAAGTMNPQIRFGEDLMSRVSYAMMNPGGAARMTEAIRGALGSLATELARSAGIETTDILELTLVGNPIMHHLVLGLDPVELGGAPFALAVDQALTIPASALHLAVHPNARVYVLPCIAGHVGADAAGMILAERPDQGEPITLLVDVGTNAEIVLGNRDRLLACSSPTGPAFEGAQISCGQRAAPGAIERVRIDASTLEPRIKVIGSDLWSDDPGFAAATARTGVTGVCGSGIIEVIAEMFLAGIINQDGVVDGALAARTDRIVADGRTFSYVLHRGDVPMKITQNDVRAIQLAKAALYAGVRLLMDHLGIDKVDRIRLAGAFGSHIDVKHAMVLGMIPDCALDAVASVGNAAGAGARIALLDSTARAAIEGLVRRVEKIETAIEPRFQAHFIEAMAIPHKSAGSPELSKVLALPVPRDSAARGNARGRRRRPASAH